MSYIIRIFDLGKIIDIDLKDKKIFTIGSSSKDDYIVEGLDIKPRHIIFQMKHDIWQIKCVDKTF